MDIIFVQRRTLLLTVNHLHNSENLNKSLTKVSKSKRYRTLQSLPEGTLGGDV
jgi:hypothetical protein